MQEFSKDKNQNKAEIVIFVKLIGFVTLIASSEMKTQIFTENISSDRYDF